MLKIVFIVVLAVVTTQAQEHRCVAPTYFQARLLAYDHETGYYRDGRFSYDAASQRVRMIERVNENATRPQVDELFLHHENKAYRVDLKTRKCNVSTIDRPFRLVEVPEQSQYIGESSIGSLEVPGAGVLLSTWFHMTHDTEVVGNLTTSFTKEECIPYSETFHGYQVKSKQHLSFHRKFFDVTIGLDDPNIFDVPYECRGRI
ncbi:mammalian ependymin-related protein 1-like [Clavelina lepadiformis]|uniref:mammalian ependymin-related protein 1-like n=1 Tax=Clavelina lepadiformis TaxID=159417 RepID=UPI0040425D97